MKVADHGYRVSCCCPAVIVPEANFQEFQGGMRCKFRQSAVGSSMELNDSGERINSMEVDLFAIVFWDHRVRQRPDVSNVGEQRLPRLECVWNAIYEPNPNAMTSV